MERITNMFWEVGKLLSNVSWVKGKSLQSPVLKTTHAGSWWLDFYPAGDDENADSLVFCLNRSNVDEDVQVIFEIQFCFYTTPVKQYTLQHLFEKGEDIHKWVIDDVKNLAQLKIFIPPSTLCVTGYLTVYEKEYKINSNKLNTKIQNFAVNA